ncbi:MAG: DUF2267 domain-containing protein [Deltaproteobacteria bacterium]|nr:DUF2267 domain-containing protein [Deltaproteobacteria bacterium]
MSTTGLDSFDKTLQKSQIWLNDVIRELEWQESRPKAYLALHSVLHALRDRLTGEEAVHLGAQLPMLIRGLYYEGWKLSGKPVKERHKAAFLAHVKAMFRDDPTVDPEQVARAVFKVVARHITAGETKDIKALLPGELRELWP